MYPKLSFYSQGKLKNGSELTLYSQRSWADLWLNFRIKLWNFGIWLNLLHWIPKHSSKFDWCKRLNAVNINWFGNQIVITGGTKELHYKIKLKCLEIHFSPVNVYFINLWSHYFLEWFVITVRLCTLVAEKMLEDNVELRRRLQKKALPRKEYYEIPLDNGQSK